MDALIEPSFFGALPDDDELDAELIAHARRRRAPTRTCSTALRLFGQEQMFLIGARILSGTVSAEQAGEAFARLADVVVRALHRARRGQFRRRRTAASAASRARCWRSASSAAAR